MTQSQADDLAIATQLCSANKLVALPLGSIFLLLPTFYDEFDQGCQLVFSCWSDFVHSTVWGAFAMYRDYSWFFYGPGVKSVKWKQVVPEISPGSLLMVTCGVETRQPGKPWLP